LEVRRRKIKGKQREIEEAHRVVKSIFSRRRDFFLKRWRFVRVFGSIDGLMSGVLHILGYVCLIAGTVIRSGGCTLSLASP